MSTTASNSGPGALSLVSRIAAALFGGYVFCWGLSSFGIAVLVALGVGYDTARIFWMLLVFLIFLVVFLWAFAARSTLKVWLVLAGAGALMSGAALWLQNTIVINSV